MESKIYSQTGKEVGKIKLPETVFGLPKNESLVHQVVVAMMGNMRQPSAHTKNRGEVSGTGKKPWKQKGTGRARHGSRRSPIWVGGGVAHGPRNERDYSRKINKKMRVKALYTVLSEKFKDGEIIFIDSLSLDKPKTKDAKSILSSFSTNFSDISKRKNATLIVSPEKMENVAKSFKNFGNVEMGFVKDLNPVDILKYKYLVLAEPEKSVGILESRMK
jgi:large subunit ribosomal protein L4